MRIEPTTHEHGLTAKVYTYEGDYEVADDVITWHAWVHHVEEPPRTLSGTIPIGSPALRTLADKAVHDAIVQHIDAQGASNPSEAQPPPVAIPVRTPLHDALQAFIGQWRAEGLAYGGPRQSETDPKGAAQPWRSTHTARWHSGRYFVVHDEQAQAGADLLDTLSVMGVDAHSGQLFARCFENHGFERRYDVTVEGRRWTLVGARERATIEFSIDGRSQHIVWQWRPRERWLPLCERTAVRSG